MTKILVIEDELFIRETIVEILEDEGYEIISADNGLTGYEVAVQDRPDLILCDIMMPQLDGYETLKKLRSNPSTLTTPFIYLTAKDQRNDYRQGMNLGADDYLVKPFTKNELLNAVETRIAKQIKEKNQYLIQFKQEEESFKQVIYYDDITGLPNQFLLQQYFNLIVNLFKGINQETKLKQTLVVYCVELPQLNLMESTLESSKIEALQVAIAERLKKFTTSKDLVARLKNNQFFLLLQEENKMEKIEKVAQDIIDSLSRSFANQEQNINLAVNLGISIYPEDGTIINQLIKNAEIGLYYAKREGTNRYKFYTKKLTASSLEELQLENDLREAINQQQFQLYYQPLVSVSQEKIVAVESLIRWNHAQRGFISPVEFIPLAESTGLILQIGEWVLRTACKQAKTWQLAGYPSIRVGVNISTRQLNHPNLIDIVRQIIQETGISPKTLDLEITETSMMENPQLALENLNKLKELGVTISIDDFGTGYSSLGYLHQFPFDHLKVDRVFIHNIDRDAKKAEITKAIRQIAQNLDIIVIAEGVETKAELDLLKRYCFNELQGYYFSRPLPPNDLEKLFLQKD